MLGILNLMSLLIGFLFYGRFPPFSEIFFFPSYLSALHFLFCVVMSLSRPSSRIEKTYIRL